MKLFAWWGNLENSNDEECFAQKISKLSRPEIPPLSFFYVISECLALMFGDGTACLDCCMMVFGSSDIETWPNTARFYSWGLDIDPHKHPDQVKDILPTI